MRSVESFSVDPSEAARTFFNSSVPRFGVISDLLVEVEAIVVFGDFGFRETGGGFAGGGGSTGQFGDRQEGRDFRSTGLGREAKSNFGVVAVVTAVTAVLSAATEATVDFMMKKAEFYDG